MSDNLNYLKSVFESGGIKPFDGKLVDFFPAVVLVYNVDDKKLVYVNKKIKDFTGFSFDEIRNSEFGSLVFKDDLELVYKELEKFDTLSDQESYCYSCRFNHKEGHWRNFKTSGSVLQRTEEGKPQSLLFIAQDVTDQLKSAEEIKSMHELLEETEELLDFGSWHWDLSKNLISMTDGVYKIFEIEPNSSQEVPDDFLMQYVIEEDKERVKKAIKESLSNHRDLACEYIIRTGKNNLRHVLSKGKMVAKDGHAHKMIGITHDITYLKNSDRERERIIRELKHSNKELEEFAYAASHDLQEPLRKITTFGERLSVKFSDKLGSDGSLYVERMMTSAKNMRILIDNLLEFSRTTRSTYNFVPVDLNIVMQTVLEELDLKITENQAVIEISTLPEVEAVEAEMKQLFSNLVSNAIKFRNPEIPPVVKITYKVTSLDDRSKYQLPHDREYVTISVMDNGIGFEEEYAMRIFQIFQRLHGKSEYPGSGIGLAICKKIVDNHNGVILTESKLGKGANFIVILPVKQIQ